MKEAAKPSQESVKQTQGEYVQSVLESTRKNLGVRAGFNRQYLKGEGINDETFASNAAKLGVAFDKSKFDDDSELVKAVIQIQAKIGLPQEDSSQGQDGMFGPYTFEKFNAYTEHAQKKVDSFVEAVTERKDALVDTVKGMFFEEEDKPAGAVVDSAVEAAPEDRDRPGETPRAKLEAILEKYEGKKYVGRLPGNGGRRVSIYIPEGFDPSAPTELIYQFHGTTGHMIDVPLPKLPGTSDHYKSLQGKKGVGDQRFSAALSSARKATTRKSKNVIMIYPLSEGRRETRKSGAGYRNVYDTEWMKKGNNTGDDMQKLHDSTFAKVQEMLGVQIKKPSVTVSGHSAGGIALTNILESGFKPDKVKFLDASYGDWVKRAHRSAPKTTKVEIYVKGGTETDRLAKSLEKKPNVKYVRSRIRHGQFVSAFIAA